MERYTLNDIAVMTGLTTRTLRNYLRQGLLQGEKEDGIWWFSEKEFAALIEHPAVKPGIRAKRHSIVYDFMVTDSKKENQTCMILDISADRDEARKTADFFCNRIKEQAESEVRFGFEWHKKNVRVILSGPENAVKEIIESYYEYNRRKNL
ncbi:MAG: helix-turn-helix domain-containing protein [Lachnospiraceae bacterium]